MFCGIIGEYMAQVIIIGGGAAGMMASIFAARKGHEVHVIEKNEKLGKKLFITGKGRCNITNESDVETHLSATIRNRKFLYSAFYGFDAYQTMDFFKELGLPIKVERGGRVFPVSDRSSDVIRALSNEMERLGVKVHLNSEVKKLCCARRSDLVMGDTLDHQSTDSHKEWNHRSQQFHVEIYMTTRKTIINMTSDACIVATGGISYASTGSTGDGYEWASQFDHQLIPVLPSLVPVDAKEWYVKELQGLSLKNVHVSIRHGKKLIYDEFGEMLFTHFGVSGPILISASSILGDYLPYETQSAGVRYKENLQKRHVHAESSVSKVDKKSDLSNRKRDASNKILDSNNSKLDSFNKKFSELSMTIDLKPALSVEQLDARILRDFDENLNRQFKNAIDGLLPSKLKPIIIELSKIEPNKRVNEITKQERMQLISLLKEFPMTLTKLRGFNEAIITRGGVSVRDIDPSTMESKKIPGLYFIGEVLDLDALTGGFNLQIAWSTAYLAGTNMPI